MLKCDPVRVCLRVPVCACVCLSVHVCMHACAGGPKRYILLNVVSVALEATSRRWWLSPRVIGAPLSYLAILGLQGETTNCLLLLHQPPCPPGLLLSWDTVPCHRSGQGPPPWWGPEAWLVKDNKTPVPKTARPGPGATSSRVGAGTEVQIAAVGQLSRSSTLTPPGQQEPKLLARDPVQVRSP